MNINNGKPIELKNRKLFEDYFKNFPSEISEFSFTNLFIWNKYYNYLYLEYNDHLVIYSREYFKKWRKSISRREATIFFMPPIGPNPVKIILEIFKSLKNVEFHRVPEPLITSLNEEGEFEALNIEILEDRNNWDYVYQKDDLINLPGNKFRQKRRWLNKFLEQYDYDFQVITENLVEEALQLQLEWCDVSECQSNEELAEEQKAIKLALENCSDLGFSGGIIFIDGKCIAYTLGEMLNKETIVIHIEKAHFEYEGSYQAINNLFLKEFGKNAIYVNRQQDLGIEGLRRAKEAYKPIRMVKKSIVYRK